MENRPYLTSAEAATYCGFKTIGGIQQAVRRGKLKPAGRRGGTGTYVFATADLDLFLTGGLQPGRPVATQNSQVAQPPSPKAPSGHKPNPPGDEEPVARIVRALSSGGATAANKKPSAESAWAQRRSRAKAKVARSGLTLGQIRTKW